MKTYKPKELGHIQAQKFRSGQDKGSWPPCVEKHRWKANVYEVRMNDNAPYSYADVAEGDWVVLASSGWRHVLKPLEFEAKYEELEPEVQVPDVVEVVDVVGPSARAKRKAKGHRESLAAEELRQKIQDVRTRVEEATRPGGPLSVIKVTTTT